MNEVYPLKNLLTLNKFFKGMQGIDGKFALLKMAQTDLSVKRKKLTDKNILSAEEKAYLQYGSAQPAFLFA